MADLQRVLSYLDRGLDDPTCGYITADDLKSAFREMYLSCCSGDVPNVTINETPGATPDNTPPGDPHTGDVFVNERDHISWIYAPDRQGTLAWNPFGGGGGGGLTGPYVSNVAPGDPTANGVALGHLAVEITDAQGPAWTDGGPIPAGPTGPIGPTGPTGKKGDPGDDGKGIIAAQLGDPNNPGTNPDVLYVLMEHGQGQPPTWQPVGQVPAGPTGSQGPTGPIGPIGSTGPQGQPGPVGPDGKVFWSILGDGANGARGHLYRTTDAVDPTAQPPAFQGATPPNWTDLGSLVGPMGPAITVKGHIDATTGWPTGTPARGDAYIITALPATNVPAPSTGGPFAVGDFAFFDGTNWHNGGVITGPKGDPGTAGLPGAQGPAGDSITGVFISDGATTINGQTYPQGHLVIETTLPNDPQHPFYTDVGLVVGAQGPAGPPGAPGTPGNPGAQGPQGVSVSAFSPVQPGAGAGGQDLIEVTLTDGTKLPITGTFVGPAGQTGAQGPIGPAGPQGAGVTITAAGPGGAAPATPSTGDTYIYTAGSPVPAGLTGQNPPNPGDGIAWDGTKWHNVGPIRGPRGLTGGSVTAVAPGDPTAGSGNGIPTGHLAIQITDAQGNKTWTDGGPLPSGQNGVDGKSVVGVAKGDPTPNTGNGVPTGHLAIQITDPAVPGAAGTTWVDAGLLPAGAAGAKGDAGDSVTDIAKGTGPTGNGVPVGNLAVQITDSAGTTSWHDGGTLPPGPTGTAGPTGAAGPTGPTGPTGAAGPAGADGKVFWEILGDGTNGTAGHLYRTDAPVDPTAAQPAFTGATPTGWTDLGSVQGPMGPGITVQGHIDTAGGWPTTQPGGSPLQGGDAFIITSLPSTGVPTPTTGGPFVIGDFAFFDGTNWHNGGDIQGPKGDPGAAGATGPAGPAKVSTDAGNIAKLGTDGLVLVDPIVHPENTITESTTAAETPTTNPPSNPINGDVFINRPDAETWVYDGTNWVLVPHPAGNAGQRTITVLTNTQENPSTNAPASPVENDLVINDVDHESWIYTGGNWERLSQSIIIADDPPANPVPGDFWLDDDDFSLSVFYDDGSTQQWVVISGPNQVAGVTVTATATQTPASNPPASVSPGDIFVNTTDNLSWVFDPASGWTLFGGGGGTTAAPPTVTATVTAGETPTTAPPANPVSGDTFINTTDHTSWVFDGANWVDSSGVGGSGEDVTVETVTGLAPSQTSHPNAQPGDIYINDADGLVWVFTDNAAGANAITTGYAGTAGWEPLPSAGATLPTVTVETHRNRQPPVTSTTVGDIWIDTSHPRNDKSFIWDGTAWRELFIEQHTFASKTPGDTPTQMLGAAAAQGSVFTGADIGEGTVASNIADHKFWVWSYLNARQHGVRYTDHAGPAGDTPMSVGAVGRDGDWWENTVDHNSWVFDRGAWVRNPPDTPKWWGWREAGGSGSGGGGAAPGTVTTTANTGEDPATNAPASPVVGDVFINTADSFTWIYDGATWVEVPHPAATAATGLPPSTPADAGRILTVNTTGAPQWSNTKMWFGTAAQYAAVVNPDPGTLYVVTN